ncbi:MAG TPA: hypothetical protein VFS43_25950 [Polyangiaceae bacterium]|nr:hypothetical protein [Polyangiaceae bacterium]
MKRSTIASMSARRMPHFMPSGTSWMTPWVFGASFALPALPGLASPPFAGEAASERPPPEPALAPPPVFQGSSRSAGAVPSGVSGWPAGSAGGDSGWGVP